MFIFRGLLGSEYRFTVEHLWRFITTTFKVSNYTVTYVFEWKLSRATQGILFRIFLLLFHFFLCVCRFCLFVCLFSSCVTVLFANGLDHVQDPNLEEESVKTDLDNSCVSLRKQMWNLENSTEFQFWLQ